jgi:hypothetical protein
MSFDKEEIANRVAHQAYNVMGYTPDAARLEYSILGVAWRMGFPSPDVEDLPSGNTNSRWQRVPLLYHLQEALVIRFWSMQAELLFGYLSKIASLTEQEFGLPILSAGIQPMDVLRGMTRLLLVRAKQRAEVARSPGMLSEDEVVDIYNSLVLRYEELAGQSVQDHRPIPTNNFQLGLSKDHPWTAFQAFCGDNLCSALPVDEAAVPIASMLMGLATASVQTGLYSSLKSL